MIPLDQILAGLAAFCAVIALALAVLLFVVWAGLSLDAPKMKRDHALETLRYAAPGSRAHIVAALERLVWRGRVTVIQDQGAFVVHVRLVTPDPRALFARFRAAREAEAARVVRMVAPLHVSIVVAVSHPLRDAWAQLRTAMLFHLPAGRGCGPRTRRVVGVDLATLPDRTVVTAVHVQGNTITRIDQRELAPRPSAEELAKFMRETSLRPANHSANLNSSPAPEPASPWDDEITKVVTIVDPTEKGR